MCDNLWLPAGHEQDAHTRVNLEQVLCEVGTVQVVHNDIREQEGNPYFVLTTLFERVDPAGGGQELVAVLGENVRREGEHLGLIIYYQNYAGLRGVGHFRRFPLSLSD